MDLMGCSALLLLMFLFIVNRKYIKALECSVVLTAEILMEVSLEGLKPTSLLCSTRTLGPSLALAEDGVSLYGQELTRANQR